MDGPVTHENQGVALLYLEPVFVNLLALDDAHIPWYLHEPAVPYENAARVVIFHQIGITVMIHLKDAEGGICHLPHLADWECLTDGIHTLLQGSPIKEHGS